MSEWIDKYQNINKYNQLQLQNIIINNKRKDSRHPLEIRKSLIKFDELNSDSFDLIGSAAIRRGRSTTIATITNTFTESNYQTRQGQLEFNVSISPVVPLDNDEALDLSSRLQMLLTNVIIKSNTFNLSQLFGNDESIYLNISITVLSLDGNIDDCVILAALTVLKNSEVFDVSDSNYNKRKLKIDRSIIPITAGLSNGLILLDMTSEEEKLVDYIVTIAVDELDQICYFNQIVFNSNANQTSTEIETIISQLISQSKQLRQELQW